MMTMSSCEILGLPVSEGLPSDGSFTFSPYAVAAVVKGIDSDGDEGYAVLVTDGMMAMDLAGIAKYLTLYADERLKDQIRAAFDN
jgi:hypothetical protein